MNGYEVKVGDRYHDLPVCAATEHTFTVDTGERLGFPFEYGTTRKETFLRSDVRAGVTRP